MHEQNPAEAQHDTEVSEEELEAVSGGTLGLLSALIGYVVRAEPDAETGPPPPH
jgi:hypothetical protein